MDNNMIRELTILAKSYAILPGHTLAILVNSSVSYASLRLKLSPYTSPGQH